MGVCAPLFLLGILAMSEIKKTTASECCSAYTDGGYSKSAFWCATYCCYKSGFGLTGEGRECCDSSYRRVYSWQRDSDCEWLDEHRWMYAIIGIGSIGSIGLCIFGCVKCCCQSRPIAVAPLNQPQVSVLAVNSQQQSHMTQQSHMGQHPGYSMQSGPHPPPYNADMAAKPPNL
ncbi:hypothetical protein MAR_022812 [Mya arenaria]|uniref:Uncharacterized protein n=1 Tax=Mya arenaria TaxID=6604 RepID=A0ABY7DM49_MYAAR|nr:uncharacterized protein LOC128229060 [Mya arenaria]WAQ98439.1 hypothetical protein MAR_022812 [Mya arenaria]